MTVMADAAPGVAPVVVGAAGPAGGVGPVPAGVLHDAVADAADPFGGARRSDTATARQMSAPDAAGLVPQRLEPLLMLAAGIAFIVGVSVLRSRQRRRRGWGVLPERSNPDSRLWQ